MASEEIGSFGSSGWGIEVADMIWKRGKKREKMARFTTGSDLETRSGGHQWRARTKECEVRGERDARPPGEEGDGETETDKVAPPLFEVLDPFGESPAGLEPGGPAKCAISRPDPGAHSRARTHS